MPFICLYIDVYKYIKIKYIQKHKARNLMDLIQIYINALVEIWLNCSRSRNSNSWPMRCSFFLVHYNTSDYSDWADLSFLLQIFELQKILTFICFVGDRQRMLEVRRDKGKEIKSLWTYNFIISKVNSKE